MKQTYDVFIKCTNKIILLVAGEDVHVLQKGFLEHPASQLNTGGISYCFSLLRPSASGQSLFFFFFFYDSGVEYQVTHSCCFVQRLRGSSDCKRS